MHAQQNCMSAGPSSAMVLRRQAVIGLTLDINDHEA
jgi:hypothetical protein